jgi:hypothetical protein
LGSSRKWNSKRPIPQIQNLIISSYLWEPNILLHSIAWVLTKNPQRVRRYC